MYGTVYRDYYNKSENKVERIELEKAEYGYSQIFEYDEEGRLIYHYHNYLLSSAEPRRYVYETLN